MWAKQAIRSLAALGVILVGISTSACAGERISDGRLVGDREMVVLLHGLGRSEAAMWFLAARLEAADFDVVRIGYDSLRDPPEQIVAAVSLMINACCKKCRA